jgi:hypothetical protein
MLVRYLRRNRGRRRVRGKGSGSASIQIGPNFLLVTQAWQAWSTKLGAESVTIALLRAATDYNNVAM